MNPEPENFQNLRRLLALKRHEQPPPGYFEHFSSNVIARIRAGEVGHESWLERLLEEAPWLQQLWSAFSGKPILAGGFGLAVCGVLVAGVILSDDTNPASMAVLPAPDTSAVVVQSPTPAASPMVDRTMTVSFSSTAGELPQTSPSIFQEFKQTQRPLFQRVDQSYVIPGAN